MPDKPGTHYRHTDGSHTLTVEPRALRPGVAIVSYGLGGFRVHNLAPTCVRELVDTLNAILETERLSELSRDERQRLADALHEGMDGDLLIGAGKGIGMLGNDVPLSEARPDEVVWWAVERVAPVVAAIAEERAGWER
jgi:hypothetical protein